MTFNPVNDNVDVDVEDCPTIPEPPDLCNCSRTSNLYNDFHETIDGDGGSIGVAIERVDATFPLITENDEECFLSNGDRRVVNLC